jgi:hypothetical protein
LQSFAQGYSFWGQVWLGFLIILFSALLLYEASIIPQSLFDQNYTP